MTYDALNGSLNSTNLTQSITAYSKINLNIHTLMISPSLYGSLGAFPPAGSRNKAPKFDDVFVFHKLIFNMIHGTTFNNISN